MVQLQKIRRTTLAALVVGGLVSTGSGIAFAADHGATATGGSSTGGDLSQQNTAQAHRQNNNCSNPNSFLGAPRLTDSLAETRCATGDASFNKDTLTEGGGASTTGGSSTAENVVQQNTAQKGRQNNNCSNPNASGLELVDSRLRSHCTAKDLSHNKHSGTKTGGARTTGGSSTAGTAFEQNTAQEGRQNNNCANPNASSFFELMDSRADSHCTGKDRSHTKHAVTKTGGAHTTGGSSQSAFVAQQNTAQEGRQNANCANPNSNFELADSRARSHCTGKDRSRTKHAVTKTGGARTTGGSSTAGTAFEQNTAQEGRQNANCANPNVSGIDVADSRLDSHCTNKDRSHTKHALTKTGGARTTGGTATADAVLQQNTAQEGRQNANCANPNVSIITPRGGRVDSHCTNKDGSHTKHAVTKTGGARTTGGSSQAAFVAQQNTAQEGRQNNNCANPNNSSIGLSDSGRVDSHCTNKDRSHTKHTVTKTGGARTTGGSSTAGTTVTQQNTAQEGRQNNNCANLNASRITATGGRVDSHCTNKDGSHTKHAVTKTGGARTTGGSSTAGTAFQQNTAQEGRQNNNCANPNNSSITLTDSRAETRCKTIDHSTRVGTAEISDGAEAEGGSSTAGLFQQNTAQEGRQNNNCGNPNSLTLTASGSHTRAQCVAVDRSKNIGSVSR
ncbi:hypothetical protein [Streptomyces sp. 8N706]|uniref:hypothetical protein n=1 Tax=Streptomyces sp. 8N706 TaxID=3457416 RepID=UPI003FD30149